MYKELYVCKKCLIKKFGQIDLNLVDLPEECSFNRDEEKKGIIIRFRIKKRTAKKKRDASIVIMEVSPKNESLNDTALLSIVRIHLRRLQADEVIDNIRFSEQEENYFEK